MNQTLFRKTSLESISSPDQLNDYIKVSNPSIWMVVAALFILLTAVFVWGFTGNLPTTVSADGVTFDGNVICYIDTTDANHISIGQSATAVSGSNEWQGQITQITNVPMSAAEIADELASDYLVQALTEGDYAVKINITLENSDLADATLVDIRIVTASMRPIDFLLK